MQRTKSEPRNTTPLNIAKAIVAHLRENGHFAAITKPQNASSSSGLADVYAVVCGSAMQIAVLRNTDNVSSERMLAQAVARKAGGLYEFVSTFAEYLQLYNALTK